MVTLDTILQCLHRSPAESWLGKRFLYVHFVCPEKRDNLIFVNYNTKEAYESALLRLTKAFPVDQRRGDRFYIEGYSIRLTVKKWAHTTDYDLLDYNPVTKQLVSIVAPQTPVDAERFVKKECVLVDSVLEMFQHGGEQDELIRRNLRSYIANGWTFRSSIDGRLLEFSSADTKQWKLRFFEPYRIKFSIGDLKYERVVDKPIDSYILYHEVIDLVNNSIS